jgi:hypothetical protein
VVYSNLAFAAVISSPDHPIWQWLAKRSGRVAGLSLNLRLEDSDPRQNADQLSKWIQPLQTLSGIPGVELRLEWVGIADHVDHPCIVQWLKQHGQLISHLIVEVDVDSGLELRDFSKAAAACRSIDLTMRSNVIDLSDLSDVAGCLHRLYCGPDHDWIDGSLGGTSTLESMSQLTALHLNNVRFVSDEPWSVLAKLTSLQWLEMRVNATGDPSPLSALTGLRHLKLQSLLPEEEGRNPFSFSSLQPLSTLQQLEELHLYSNACAATSLQGLAGLSDLRKLEVGALSDATENYEGRSMSLRLRSLEGISTAVQDFTIRDAPDLMSLDGIEGCTSMENLSLTRCGIHSLLSLRGLSSLKRLEMEHCEVTSLQPLSQLGAGLQSLCVSVCRRVQEKVLELPLVLPTAHVDVIYSNVKEVVLAGGMRRPATYRLRIILRPG